MAVEIEWVDSTSQAATGNKVYRDTVPSTGEVEIADIANGVQFYSDDTVAEGTQYKFEVQAHDGAGDETTQEVEGVNMDYITTQGSLAYILDTYTNSVGAYSLQKIKGTATLAVQVQREDLATTDVLLEDTGSINLSSTVSAGGTLGAWAGTDTVIITIWYDQDGANNMLAISGYRELTLIESGVLVVDSSGNTSAKMNDDGTKIGMSMDHAFVSDSATVFFNASTIGIDDAYILFNGDTTSKWGLRSTAGSGSNPDSSFGNSNYYKDGVIVSPKSQGELCALFSQGTICTGTMTDLELGTNLYTQFRIGGYDANTDTLIPDHFFNELIIFDSDENANQAAIESDIISRY